LIRQQLSLSLLVWCTKSCAKALMAVAVWLPTKCCTPHRLCGKWSATEAAQLPNALQTGSQFGMQTLAQSLAQLQTQGVISANELARHAG
jgi:Tfp pilus assembly pilus retraction ATPase PilT